MAIDGCWQVFGAWRTNRVTDTIFDCVMFSCHKWRSETHKIAESKFTALFPGERFIFACDEQIVRIRGGTQKG